MVSGDGFEGSSIEIFLCESNNRSIFQVQINRAMEDFVRTVM